MAPTRGKAKAPGEPAHPSEPTSRRSSQPKQTRRRDQLDSQGPGSRTRSGRQSGVGARPAGATRADVLDDADNTRKRKRKRNADEGGLSASATITPHDYIHLEHSERHIAENIVTSKWKPPTQQVQAQVRELFTVAARSVILTRRDDKKRADAEKLMKRIVQRLERRLPKMLLPPNSKGVHFDLNQLRERNRILENQLTPAHHANELLEWELRKAELDLEDKKLNLAELKDNLENAKALQQKQDNPHPLLGLPKKFKTRDDGPDDIGLKPATRLDTSIVGDADSNLDLDLDPDLGPLLEQLRRSLESMHGNHEQLQGVDEAMRYATLALDEVLFRHASGQQYDAL